MGFGWWEVADLRCGQAIATAAARCLHATSLDTHTAELTLAIVAGIGAGALGGFAVGWSWRGRLSSGTDVREGVTVHVSAGNVLHGAALSDGTPPRQQVAQRDVPIRALRRGAGVMA